MAWRIVKQPNGLLARFSDVVDNFTDVNMTIDEAIQACIWEYNCGPKTAEQKVQNALDDIKPGTINVKGSGLDRWNDCIQKIQNVQGEEAWQEILKEIEHE